MKSKINMQLDNSQELRVEVTEYFSNVFQNKIDDPTKKEIILLAHHNLFIEHYDSNELGKNEEANYIKKIKNRKPLK